MMCATIPPARHNGLKSSETLRFPPTRGRANIYARPALCGVGQGHNATTIGKVTVVPTVVGYSTAKTDTYAKPQRHNAQKRSLTRVCVHARAHVRGYVYFRCSVVVIPYPFEIIAEKATTVGTTVHGRAVVGVVGCRCGATKSLKTNKKGGF